MARSAAFTRIKTDVLTIVRALPTGRVTTFDALGRHLDVEPRHIAYILAMLGEHEREIVPWHRVVAKGGAIGRGPHRDQQFAKLVREGVMVSPAGIVQDLDRVAVKDIKAPPPGITKRPEGIKPPAPLSRSRGMKDRPA
jgi:methylated-DNA-protein-cysteine methyltransferase related protein